MPTTLISGPTATPHCAGNALAEGGIYGPSRGLRLTSDEQAMLDDLVQHYGETPSAVLRVALRHLFERLCSPGEVSIPQAKVS